MERCPDPQEDCREETPFADDHHRFWPANEYRTPVEKKFRNLECNIVRGICRCLHNQEHMKPPPEKPSVAQMRREVFGHE